MMNQIARSHLDKNQENDAVRVNFLLVGTFRRNCFQVVDMILPLSGQVYEGMAGSSEDVNLVHEVMYQESLPLIIAENVDQAMALVNGISSERHRSLLKPKSLSLLAYCVNSLMQRNDVERERLEVVGLFNEKLRRFEDTDWFLRARDSGVKMELMPDVLVRRRFHEANVTRTDHCRSREAALELVQPSLARRRGQPRK